MIEEAATAGIPLGDSENENAPSAESRSDSEVSEGPESASASLDYTGPSGFAKSHLEHVSERLQNKLQALTALKRSLKPDSKVLSKLQGEVDSLHGERREVSLHIE